MKILMGSEKQVKWASDIRNISIELLEAKKKDRGDLGDYIDIAIENIENIEDAGYLINNLKDITYKKGETERFNTLIEWMEYTKHEDFKELLSGLSYKKTTLNDKYKDLFKDVKLERKPSWIDSYDVIEVIQCDF